ncbi:hypothetical protein [Paractinoplanes hotanensis]|uniref:Uncharacterized protein n=1 Tax=Paractinoplanes hotanensis TaxID=2906497 RepID=A0ABT0Y837_9ACTN|nr:hypothetical protein [Actinoplanes hotanensis]MCM4082212.1 hypothetical protein [Actinoplanes hotanensis]
MDNQHSEIIPALFQGDLVVIAEEHQRPDDRGLVFEITRVNPVNWSLSPVNGDRPLRCPPEMLRKATAEEITAAQAAPPVAPVHCGTVVTVQGPGWRQPAKQLWCVLRLKGQHHAELGRLGGDIRIYPKVPRKYLTPLTDDQVVAMIEAAKAA